MLLPLRPRASQLSGLQSIRNKSPIPPYLQCARHFIDDSLSFRENDVVFLQAHGRNSFLTKPLSSSKIVNTTAGPIPHSEIIGKRVGHVIALTDKNGISRNGRRYNLRFPTLAEYITLTDRRVTPIYPADANVIVSLLDINVPSAAPLGRGEEPFEILEAGSGHGGLTLPLARAIHAANTPPPTELGQIPVTKAQPTRDNSSASETTPPEVQKRRELSEDGAEADPYQSWKSRRQAILHSVDANSRFSEHAQQVVRNFRRGLYYHHVDFYSQDVSAWLNHELSTRAKSSSATPFLAHIVLDLASPEKLLAVAAEALRRNGKLILFTPSITQAVQCVQTARANKLRLRLDKVLEIGNWAESGGREWDIGIRMLRALEREELAGSAESKNEESEGAESAESSKEDMEGAASAESSEDTLDEARTTPDEERDVLDLAGGNGWKLFCRPAFARPVRPSFLTVFRKTRGPPEY